MSEVNVCSSCREHYGNYQEHNCLSLSDYRPTNGEVAFNKIYKASLLSRIEKLKMGSTDALDEKSRAWFNEALDQVINLIKENEN